MDKGIPGVTRLKAFGVAAVVIAAIAAVLFFVYPGLLGPSRTASDASLLNSLREATPPVLEPGTVVYLEALHKLGPLIVGPSLAKDLLPWDTASYDYRTESRLLMGDDGKLAKSYYRKVSPDGTVLEEDFRDAELGREYNYFPRTGALLRRHD